MAWVPAGVKILGAVTGSGFSQNILECYRFIFENYEAGDKIFLFGFSRGAATMRSLSGFMHLFGILPKSRYELIPQAHSIYKIRNEEKRLRRAKEFVERHHTMWCRIKFLGVWDTVAALGLPIKWLDVLIDQIPIFHHSFHNLRLSKSVEHARHALAIDDERLVFHPVLWDRQTEDYQSMKQVWFSGMHSDVGGSYAEQELSDIPLIWMLEEAKQQGLRIYPDNTVVLTPKADGVMHDPRAGIGRFYRRRQRSWSVEERGSPTVHEGVLLRRNLMPSYDPWILRMDPEVEPWPEPR